VIEVDSDVSSFAASQGNPSAITRRREDLVTF
jgi:hypothetical protein